MSVPRAAGALILSSISSILPAGVVATVYFAVLNFCAQDGPYFPPPLLALLVVGPTADLLLPFQLAALVLRRVTRRATVPIGWAMGTGAGVVVGLTLAYGLFASSQLRTADMLGCVAMALIQTFVSAVERGCSGEPI